MAVPALRSYHDDNTQTTRTYIRVTFSAALFLPVSLYLLSAYGWQWNFQWRSGRFKPSEYRQVREEQRLNHFPRSALITRQEKNQ